MTRYAMFSGGRGGASIARELLRTPGAELTLLINGYDNGMSTGALRRFLPGMLGPSDFRKNLLLHLDRNDPRQAALAAVLEHRMPPGSTRRDLVTLVDEIAAPRRRMGHPLFAALTRPARLAVVRDLRAFARRLDADPHGFDLADCALGNLVFAGAYLRLGRDFNAAVRSCVRTFGSPARIVNVTNGENAYLVALKEDGRLLADEADIVAPQDAAAITDLFLLPEPVTRIARAELAVQSVDRVRETLSAHRADVSAGPEAVSALRDADVIVYGPGTPHSSLLPSYLTPGVAEAITAGRATARVFVVNTHDDHESQGLSATDLVARTLTYLGDPRNERGTVTHVLCHNPERTRADGGEWAGARWIDAALEDPGSPGVHSGREVVAALARIAHQDTAGRLVRAG